MKFTQPFIGAKESGFSLLILLSWWCQKDELYGLKKFKSIQIGLKQKVSSFNFF